MRNNKSVRIVKKRTTITVGDDGPEYVEVIPVRDTDPHPKRERWEYDRDNAWKNLMEDRGLLPMSNSNSITEEEAMDDRYIRQRVKMERRGLL
jgi:hypothetical protein